MSFNVFHSDFTWLYVCVESSWCAIVYVSVTNKIIKDRYIVFSYPPAENVTLCISLTCLNNKIRLKDTIWRGLSLPNYIWIPLYLFRYKLSKRLIFLNFQNLNCYNSREERNNRLIFLTPCVEVINTHKKSILLSLSFHEIYSFQKMTFRTLFQFFLVLNFF